MRGRREGTRAKAVAWLESDLVDHAEADQHSEREANCDGEQVDVDGKPVAGVCRLGAVCVEGCHKAPW